MKLNKIVLITLSSIVILASCATTTETKNIETIETDTTTTAATSKTHTTKEKTAPAPLVVEETKEDIFIKSLEGITITKISSPKEVTKNRAFSEAFVFAATKADGSAAEGLSLTLEYPSSKSEEGIKFEKTELTTDSEGKISFNAEKPAFAAKTSVKVYPTPVSEDASLAERLKPFTAEADWKVKSDIAAKGAVLFVWEFNEKDRPINNYSNLQGEFRTRGITMVGNGPVNDTVYIGKPKSLYKDTYAIIGGTQFGYLIYGTVKFEQPVTALEDGSGYYCVLKAEIEAMSMKDGSKLYSSVTSYESKGKNWNECVSKGKDKLSELIVSDIIYGL